MSRDGDAVLEAELHETVCGVEVVAVALRMYGLALHAVLGNDGVEVFLDDAYARRIDTTDLGLVEGRADEETILGGILHGCGLLCAGRNENSGGSKKCKTYVHGRMIYFRDYVGEL